MYKCHNIEVWRLYKKDIINSRAFEIDWLPLQFIVDFIYCELKLNSLKYMKRHCTGLWFKLKFNWQGYNIINKLSLSGGIWAHMYCSLHIFIHISLLWKKNILSAFTSSDPAKYKCLSKLLAFFWTR